MIQPQSNLNLQFDKELTDKLSVHKNLDQEVIITTSDKMKLCLIDNQTHMKASREWITPLGIILSLITTLVSADFKKSLGLSPESWKALFILASLVCFCWLTVSVINAIRSRRKSSIEYIIQALKLHSGNSE